MKSGRIVVLLQGRHAGKKAVIVRAHDEGHGDRKFGHAIVAGIDQGPRKITRAMQKSDQRNKTNKIGKRSRIRPFVKCVNFNHMMPTRYTLDVVDQMKQTVGDETLTNAEMKTKARRQVRSIFENRYMHMGDAKNEKALTGAKYFFRRLRF